MIPDPIVVSVLYYLAFNQTTYRRQLKTKDFPLHRGLLDVYFHGASRQLSLQRTGTSRTSNRLWNWARCLVGTSQSPPSSHTRCSFEKPLQRLTKSLFSYLASGVQPQISFQFFFCKTFANVKVSKLIGPIPDLAFSVPDNPSEAMIFGVIFTKIVAIV